MPAKSNADLPAAFKNLTPAQKTLGRSVFNALLAKGMDEGGAIAVAIKKAKGVQEETRIVSKGANKGDTVVFKRAPGGKEYPVKVVVDVGNDNFSKL